MTTKRFYQLKKGDRFYYKGTEYEKLDCLDAVMPWAPEFTWGMWPFAKVQIISAPPVLHVKHS